MRTRRSAALGLVVVLSACAAPAPSADAPSPGSPSPSATVTDEAVTELAPTEDALPPGRYVRTAFAPLISLSLNDGWRAVQLFDGFFDVQRDVGSPHVIAVQFARPLGVFGDGLESPTDATAAVEAVRANASLTVMEASDSRIGGLEGSQITVENAGDAHAAVMQVPPGPLGIDPGRRLWIAFFDTDDGLLAIMVGGSAERWDDALAAAEPVLESVRIGD